MNNNYENVINDFNDEIENLFNNSTKKKINSNVQKINFDDYIEKIKNIFKKYLNEIESENEKKSNNIKKRKIIEKDSIVFKIPKEIEKELKDCKSIKEKYDSIKQQLEEKKKELDEKKKEIRELRKEKEKEIENLKNEIKNLKKEKENELNEKENEIEALKKEKENEIKNFKKEKENELNEKENEIKKLKNEIEDELKEKEKNYELKKNQYEIEIKNKEKELKNKEEKFINIIDLLKDEKCIKLYIRNNYNSNYSMNNSMDEETINNSQNNIQNFSKIGIENKELNCYMNSVIQNLKNISIFTSQILKNKNLNDKIFFSFQKLLNNLLNSKSLNVSLREFKKEFSQKYKIFEGSNQNDSVYFLIHLINYLHKLFNIFNKKKNTSKDFEFLKLKNNEKTKLNKFLDLYENKNNSFIHDLFYGYQMFRLMCSNCNHCDVSFQSFNILDIPLMDDENELNNLIQCINTFLYTKTNQNNNFECSSCKSNNISYSSSIIYFPKILIINLKRLGENNIIYEHNVEFPEILETNKIDKLKYFNYKYKLTGFIRHLHNRNEGGHNIAYLKDILNNEWYEFNDERVKFVRKISHNDVILLFYEMVE